MIVKDLDEGFRVELSIEDEESELPTWDDVRRAASEGYTKALQDLLDVIDSSRNRPVTSVVKEAPPPEEYVRVRADKREVSAGDIVDDIRSGMSDAELMRKYKLSSKGLQSAFRKLIKSHALYQFEIDGRISSFEDSVVIQNVRSMPRLFPSVVIPVYDAHDPDNRGRLHDVTEKGVGIRGVTVKHSELKELVVPDDDFGEFESFRFQAVCRWRKRESDGTVAAGFEITEISPSALGELRCLINAYTGVNETERSQ